MKAQVDWGAVETSIEVPAQIVERFALLLGPPMFCDSAGSDRGYRFIKPTNSHYCLLKSAKAIVAFRSALCVARAGFYTEVPTLIRVVVECCTLVEWVANAEHQPESSEYRIAVNKHVSDYFSDVDRDQKILPASTKTKQKEIHDMHGATLDAVIAAEGVPSEKSASELMSSVYIRFSKYVHAAYPETIDLYGVRLGELSLCGAPRAQKDWESLEILEAFSRTIGLAVASMIVRLAPSIIGELKQDQQVWIKGMLGQK